MIKKAQSVNKSGTGLDNRGARFYDSDVARFLSLDPHATDYPSWSDYNYVLGNPISFIDPDGKSWLGHWIRRQLISLQIKLMNSSFRDDSWIEPSNRRMEPTNETGYTLTTEKATQDGTTDNAPRRTTGGAEMLNIDPIYSIMSSTSTRNNGTPMMSRHKFFKQFDGVKNGVKILTGADGKGKAINNETKNVDVDTTVTPALNSAGEWDTLRVFETQRDEEGNIISTRSLNKDLNVQPIK